MWVFESISGSTRTQIWEPDSEGESTCESLALLTERDREARARREAAKRDKSLYRYR